MRHIISHQLEVRSLKVVSSHTTVECSRLSSTLSSSVYLVPMVIQYFVHGARVGVNPFASEISDQMC